MEGRTEDIGSEEPSEGPDRVDRDRDGEREGEKVTLGKMLAHDDLVNYDYRLSRGRNFHRTWMRMRLQ